MRPEDFSPGNMVISILGDGPMMAASMRPEDFSPGNTLHLEWDGTLLPKLQ